MNTLLKPKLKPLLKSKIIKYCSWLSLLIFVIRLVFFLQDGTSNAVENILIYIIALTSVFVMITILYPTELLLRDYLYKYRELILFNIMIFICEYLFVFVNNMEYIRTRFFAISFIVAVMNYFFLIFPRKMKKILITFFIILIPTYTIFEDIYFSIFCNFSSFKEIVTINEALESSTGVIHLHWFHYFLLTLIIITLIMYYRFEQDIHYSINSRKFQLLKGVLLFFFFLNINSQIPPNRPRMYLSDHYLYYSIFSKEKTVKTFGLVNYMYRDLFDSITPKFPDKQSLNKISNFYENSNSIHNPNDYSGIFKGKNLIVIVAESYDDKLINYELMPAISKLRDESIQFINHKVPVYPRTTSDTEFILNTGLIPSIYDGPTCYSFNENQFSQSLATLFNKKGYLTRGFHSNNKEFYTRYMVYDGFEYDEFYGKDEIPSLSSHNRFDELFLEYGKELMLPKDKPFMSFIMTLSGHSPYTNSNEAANKNLPTISSKYGDSIPDEIKYYLAAQLEVEHLVDNLFKELEDNNLLDNTVVVFTNDHYPYTMQPDVYEKYTGLNQDYEKMTGPLYIWSKGVQPTKIDKLTSSFNVLPTLANMFGLDAKYKYYFGTDVFSNDYTPLVIYKDCSWYDGINYVKDSKRKVGNANEKYLTETTDYVNKYFEISKFILRTDYFRKDSVTTNIKENAEGN